jgi:heat shock protein HtpX
MKRIFLFIVTNLAVVLLLSVVASLLGVDRYLGPRGLDLSALAGFSLVLGFGGAFLSLLMSKFIAKWSTGARVIDTPRTPMEAWLVQTVHALAQRAGLRPPEVAVYEGEPNAFATGAFRNSALVAVSTGLLETMSREEVEGVLGHEVSHIANGDMVTLGLLQGVINTFVIFLSRVLAWVIDSAMRRSDDEGPGIGYFVSSIVLQIGLGLLGSMIVAWFSRQREYRADAGSATLLGSGTPMVHALTRLSGAHSGDLPQQMTAMGINGAPGGFLSLLASHPPIEDRIRALQSRSAH